MSALIALAQPDAQGKIRAADYTATGLDPKAAAAGLVGTRGKLRRRESVR
jgi:hypothetical protein